MTWADYMKNYGYREYPCELHKRPFCKECHGPEPEPCPECGQVGFHKMSCDTGDREARK